MGFRQGEEAVWRRRWLGVKMVNALSAVMMSVFIY